MINQILGFWAPGSFELIVILIVSLIVYGIPIIVIIFIVRLLLRNKRENIRLRLEVGKLADELEKVRKQKSAGKDDPSTESG
jgi:hypothetical protein